MAKSISKNWFPIAGFTLIGLAVASFAVEVSERVVSGRGLDTYFSGTGVKWNYIAALVMLVVAVVSMVVAVGLRLLNRSTSPALKPGADHSPARSDAAPRIRVGRNELCPCGSGRKFKKCCLETPRGLSYRSRRRITALSLALGLLCSVTWAVAERDDVTGWAVLGLIASFLLGVLGRNWLPRYRTWDWDHLRHNEIHQSVDAGMDRLRDVRRR